MSKANLLIVEDNVDLCETLADVFRKVDYNVQTAFSAREAEKILRRDLIDLVLLDLKLPDASGLEVLTKMAGSPYQNQRDRSGHFGDYDYGNHQRPACRGSHEDGRL